MTPANIVELTQENFQDILSKSQQGDILLVVDFWADWCEPCKQLMPVLEALAVEYPQHILLAKLNCDEQQALAAQFGVRNLPTVALFKGGQPVDSFSGALPEQEVRALFDKHLPRPEEALLQQAQKSLAEGNAIQAHPYAQEAYRLNGSRAEVILTLAEVLIGLGKLDEAQALVDKIKMVDQGQHYQTVKAQLELARQGSDTPEIKALLAKLEQNPEDLELLVQLGVAYNTVNSKAEALETLLQVLRRQMDFGEAKKLYLDILNTLPAGDALAIRYRNQLYTLLY